MTGYVQRKLVKFLEDIKVEYDGTVRNANDKIIQCVYGDNGLNTERQVAQNIKLLEYDNNEIRQNMVYTTSELEQINKNEPVFSKELNEKLYAKLITMRDKMRKVKLACNVSTAEFENKYNMPCDLQQYITNLTANPNRKNTKIVDPKHVLGVIRELYTGSSSKIMKYNKNGDFSIKKKDESTLKLLLKFYLFDTLSPKKCTHVYSLSIDELNNIAYYFSTKNRYARVEGGEMVGFIAAQSIGEPVTQTNLKVFHKSGTGANVSGGLVRVKELLGVAKEVKLPITTLFIDDKYKTDRDSAAQIASYIRFTTLKDVVENVDICYDPNITDKNSIMRQDNVDNIFEGNQGKLGCQNDITGLPWIIRLVMSKEKMIEKNIAMLDIKTMFCTNWSSRYEDSKTSKKEYKKIIDKIIQCAIVSNYDNSDTPIIHIRFDASNYNFNTLVQFQEMVVTKYKIKGINGITESNGVNNLIQSSYVEFDSQGTMTTKKHYTIITEGINLKEMPQLNGIDHNKTTCNDITAINEMYGIEAARTAYIREFTSAIASSGGHSNYQHIEVLVDAVTHMGGLIAVNRHGANKLDTDPFSRASFEKTVEQMLAAAVFGESDHIRSVSARIMVGTLINGGTGCFDLLLDHNLIRQALPLLDQSSLAPKQKNKSNIMDLIKKKSVKSA